jgi:hypothetical protein
MPITQAAQACSPLLLHFQSLSLKKGLGEPQRNEEKYYEPQETGEKYYQPQRNEEKYYEPQRKIWNGEENRNMLICPLDELVLSLCRANSAKRRIGTKGDTHRIGQDPLL